MKHLVQNLSEMVRTNRVKILLILFSFFSLWLLTSSTANEKNSPPITFDDNIIGVDPNIEIVPKSSAGPPTGSISINNGSTTVTLLQTVPLDLSFNDTGYTGGIDQVRFSNDNVSWSLWENPLFEKNWDLTAGYGHKTVYYQIRDMAGGLGNYSCKVDYGFIGNFTQDGWTPLSIGIPGIPGNGLSWATAYRIENVSIDFNRSVTGFYLKNINTEYLIIRNCTLWNASGIAIQLDNCSRVRILDNNITFCNFGVKLLANSPGILIQNNYFKNMTDFIIGIADSNNSIIQSNEFIGTGVGGIQMYNPTNGTVIQYNNFTNHYFGAWIVGTKHIIYNNLFKSCIAAVNSDNSPTSNISYNLMNSNNDDLVWTGAAPINQNNYNTIQAPIIYSTSNFLLKWTCLPFASYYYVLNYSTPITEINNSLSVVGKAWSNQFNVTDKEQVAYYVVLGHQDYIGNSSQSNCVLISTAPTGFISINSGAINASNPAVTLSLTYADVGLGVDQVRFSNDSVTWTTWEAPSLSRAWTLPTGDGIKTVYYEIRDLAGLITQLSDTIVLDSWAPSGSIIINSGALWSNKTSVTLSLTYSDDGMGVDQVRYSNDNITWTTWEAPSVSRAWFLTTGDGPKTVYYQIRDLSLNVSTWSDTIGLDTITPNGSISINSGGSWTNSTNFTLSLSSSDTGGSGVDQVHFSNDTVTWCNWEAYSVSRTWVVPAGDGTKTVYYEIRDVAGNILRVSDTISLDTITPTGSIIINTGAVWTNTYSVNLGLTYNDANSGVDQVRFSNDTVSWTNWEAASASRAWTLPTGDGIKTVYYEIRDRAGVILRVSDTIGLDTTAPTGSITINTGAVWTGTASIILELTYNDAGIGLDQVRYSNNSVDWTNWETASGTRAWVIPTGDGNHTVYYEIRDLFGLVSQVADTIGLDTTAPTGTININNGTPSTNNHYVTLNLTYSDSSSGVDKIRFGYGGTWWADWEDPSVLWAWDIELGDGIKTVYYQIRDNVGLITQLTDTIGLDTAAPTGSIAINNDAPWTNATNVTLSLTYSDAVAGVDQVRFSNDSVDWTNWETPSASRAWNISTGDGSHIIYYEIRDLVGYVTQLSDTIGLDTTAPTGSISINTGANWTSITDVSLSLTWEDAGAGVDKIRFSNDSVDWSVWETPSSLRDWDVPAGDGNKTVYYEIRDYFGLVTQLSDSINLDTSAPTGSVTINSGAFWTNATNVTLSLIFDGGGSGVDKVRYSNNSVDWSDWEDPSASRDWNITTGDGTKTVYYEIRNLVEKIMRVFDSIGLDTIAPTGSININGGSNYVNITQITLGLTYTDAGSGVYQVRFSNDSIIWSDWEVPSASRAWTIPTGDGLKTVYFQICDNLGWIGDFSDTITLDTSVPTGTIIIYNGSAWTNTTNIYLNLTYSHSGGFGILKVRYSNNLMSWSAWEDPVLNRSWTLITGDGLRYVYFEITDEAQNTYIIFDTINQDLNLPWGSIVILDNFAATNDTNVYLNLTFGDGASGVDQVRFSNDGISWSAWENSTSNKTWILTIGDGIKTVFYQIRDNVSWIREYSDTILLDTTSPSGSILINSNAEWTNSIFVMLSVTWADSGSGIDLIRFSNDSIFWSAWQIPVLTQQWNLSTVNGNQTIFYQIRDKVGWISTYNDSVKLDNIAPTGVITINSGAIYTTNLTVNLTLSFSDLGAGINQTRFRVGLDAWSTWENSTTLRLWTLSAIEGQRTVYWQIRDNVGNIAEFSAQITVDITKPSGTIEINQGARVTQNTTIELALYYEDAISGVAQVRFSNDGVVWSAWEQPTTKKTWILESTLGLKTVYYQIKDNAGLIIDYSSTITLVEPTTDTTDPTDGSNTSNTFDIILLASVVVIIGSIVTFGVMKSKKASGKGSRNDKYRASVGQKPQKLIKVKAKPKVKLSKAKAQPFKTAENIMKSEVKLKAVDQKGEIEKVTDTGIMDVSLQFQKQPKKKK